MNNVIKNIYLENLKSKFVDNSWIELMLFVIQRKRILIRQILVMKIYFFSIFFLNMESKPLFCIYDYESRVAFFNLKYKMLVVYVNV